MSWETIGDNAENSINEHGIPNYLTSIIASSLAWISDEDLKEKIYELASLRLSERSGRTALPSISRTYTFETTSSIPISITLYEPSITADNLGHKTWLASYLLAKRLPRLVNHLPALAPSDELTPLLSQLPNSHLQQPLPSVSKEVSRHRPQVIELGAGTGLVGLAAASLFPINIHLTDLPAIIPNLQANVHANTSIRASEHLGQITVGALDWSTLPDGSIEGYDLVLAADPLYSERHPEWLVGSIEYVLKKQGDARVVVELPLREAYIPEVEEFKRKMDKLGLKIIAEGEDVGFDDWDNRDSEGQRIKVVCWWAIWKWRNVK